MIKLDDKTNRLVQMLNALDPDGPEMKEISTPVRNILKELAKMTEDEAQTQHGTLTDGQWAIVGKINEISRHIGFDLVVEPFDGEIVPEKMREQNLLLLREFPTGVVLNFCEILPEKMDTILTVIFWVMLSFFNFYKSKYEAMQNTKDTKDGA